MHSFEAKIQKHRKLTDRIADDISKIVGTFDFFIINALIFGVWIFINLGFVSYISPIDPYPFNFLTMLVSLEAIFLSIFVLMSQNRQSGIDTIREEIHLQINEIAEREVTKSLRLISEIHKSHFPNRLEDPELERMIKNTNTSAITKRIEKELAPEPLVISEFIEKFEDVFIPSKFKKK